MSQLTHPHRPVGQQDGLGQLNATSRAGTIGLIWALGGIGLAFAWLLVGYGIIRAGADIEKLVIPPWFWVSSFTILLSSVMLQWSQLAARRNRVFTANRALWLSTLLGYGFLILQAPGLYQLVGAHRSVADQNVFLYQLVIFLVLLHAAHILGGLIWLTIMAGRTAGVPCDARRAAALKNICLYWHFMAIVWIIMFNVLLLAK